MICGQPPASGGECVVVDGAAAYTDLAENEPEALQALSTPRSAWFGEEPVKRWWWSGGRVAQRRRCWCAGVPVRC
jgi:hypothetical protein